MQKMTIIALVLATVLIAGAVFASANFIQEETECSCGKCNGDCNGNCGAENCNCAQKCGASACGNTCGGNCGISSCGCS